MMMMGPRDKDHVEYERSERSVFVGNIPYEATEDQLKDIFNEVGSVVSFRLVFDRESGKPKGYGFAEYQDKETAMSAMRNLNGRELHGRPLRVDHATSEKNRNTFADETGPVRTSGPPMESEYGDPVPSKDAPEAISKAVASLPPEQMFELMRQMKQCIQNNPVEARNMLLQNPQLAYALLQAQVVMRIVDPEIAMKMLHCQNTTPPLIPGESKQDVPPEGAMNVTPGSGGPPSFNEGPAMGRMDPMEMARGDRGGFPMQPTRGGGGARMDGPMMAGGPPPMDRVPVDGPPPQGGPNMGGPPPHMVDARHGYDGGPSRHHGMPDVGRPPSPERFGRGGLVSGATSTATPGIVHMFSSSNNSGGSNFPNFPPPQLPLRFQPPPTQQHQIHSLLAEPQRGGGVPPPNHQQQQSSMMVDNFNQQRRLDPRSSAPDPRRPGGSRPNLERGGPSGGLSPHDVPQMMRGTVDRFSHEREDVKPPMDPRRAAAAAINNNPSAGGAIGSLLPQHMAHKLQQAAGGEEDAEKMKLIMQVLQLTPEQIDLLPEDQRENISALKQQFGL